MVSRHISFDDQLYTQLVQLDEQMGPRDLSDTVNLVIRKGLETLKEGGEVVEATSVSGISGDP